MKKVIIDNVIYWYNKKIGFLFYDYKMERQVPLSTFNYHQHLSFLKQIQ